MSLRYSARCLCGSITLTATLPTRSVHACHCSICRTWGGGPALCIDAEELEVVGETLAVYPSSDWAERGFCQRCGTHLFYRLKDGGMVNIPVGLFKDLQQLDFDSEIFVDHQPEYYQFSDEQFAGKRQRLTEAEVLAQFESG